MSNLDEDDDIKETQKHGVHEYILKASLTPSELISRVKKALGD
jgi:DNA-binding NarL/FixJ family response regulator